MSTQMIRILIAGALLVHGIGHTLGFWKPSRGFAFLNIPETTWRLTSNIMWIVVAMGFIVSAMSFYGVLVPGSWWRPLAVIFALISVVALILFGRSWPAFNFMAALALNLAVLIALLWLKWPPLSMLNR